MSYLLYAGKGARLVVRVGASLKTSKICLKSNKFEKEDFKHILKGEFPKVSSCLCLAIFLGNC